MKKIFTFLLSMLSLAAAAQYVGVNTTSPAANLQILGKPANTTVADGVITPRLTRAQLIAKTAYGADQVGAMVYVSDLSGATNAATANVLAIGHYYFNGTTWLQFQPQLYAFHASKNTNNEINDDAGGEVVIDGWNVEHYDTNNWFNTSNGRFTPKLAGYYRVNFNVAMYYASSRLRFALLYKNGSPYAYGNVAHGGIYSSTLSVVVYMNGTTDNLSVYHSSTYRQNAPSSNAETNFQAYYIGG
ncbi:hypothetical protein [Pedobacter xixiisoli]|nr:hypothetical protein [Pedobacter xixiisoli]